MAMVSDPTDDQIKNAAQALKDGHLVAFPTETVYGLGADATNEKAVSRVYSVKGRPTNHPLIVHISSINQLDKWAIDIPKYAIKLAEEFWPGPMTLILARSSQAKDFVTGGQETVGLRVPNHPVALALISEFEKIGGVGIAAPSANRFGLVSPTSALDVKADLNTHLDFRDLILDGGQCAIGLESTILDCTKSSPIILRPGAITDEMVKEVVSVCVNIQINQNQLRTSGSFQSHYKPKAIVVLNTRPLKGDGFIALSNIPTPKGVVRLSSPASTEEFARNFYKALRLGDTRKLKRIVVIHPDGRGLALAIKDRLIKAAAL